MPAGHLRDREVEAHDRVHRDDERRREAGQDQVGRLVVGPVPGRAAPAHGEHAVDELDARVLRPVAQRREVGDQPHEPEQQRDRRVGRDREHVPDQRALEVRPDAHRVRVRHQPVGADPGPAHVQDREHPGAGHREQRHRLGEAVDRGAPLLAQQQQDRRDQRAGVADADPPDEVDDREAPADGDVDAPDPDAPEQQPGEREQQHVHDRERDREADEPAERRLLREHEARDLVGDAREGVAGADDRRLDADRGLDARAASHGVPRCRKAGPGSRGSGCAPPRGRSCAAASAARRASRSGAGSRAAARPGSACR